MGSPSKNWSVKDGVLTCDGRPGAEWLATDDQFSDFELTLEFNVPTDGNSGVFIRAPQEGAPWVEGMEIQILDDFGDKWKSLAPAQFTGAIYEVVAPAKRVTKQAGQWQTMYILCSGRDVQVKINGQKVVDANLDDYSNRTEKVPGLNRTKGHIGLQNHGDEIAFRNILIREIADQPEQISLWKGHAPIDGDNFENADPRITVHRPNTANGTAIVICPGGGYGGLVTGPEGHGIAKWLNRHGVTGVVLEYRLPHGRSKVPLLDAQRAIRTVRTKAKDWNIDPNRVGIMGFSAGGHLASTAGTHFDDGELGATDPIDRVSCRPDFLILVYPVITMGEKTHSGSKTNLLGNQPAPALVEYFSGERQVTQRTPPTFLAHALDDKPVPPENSKAFYEALRAEKIPCKYLALAFGRARPKRLQRPDVGHMAKGVANMDGRTQAYGPMSPPVIFSSFPSIGRKTGSIRRH